MLFFLEPYPWTLHSPAPLPVGVSIVVTFCFPQSFCTYSWTFCIRRICPILSLISLILYGCIDSYLIFFGF
jgi:hypothetical protein